MKTLYNLATGGFCNVARVKLVHDVAEGEKSPPFERWVTLSVGKNEMYCFVQNLMNPPFGEFEKDKSYKVILSVLAYESAITDPNQPRIMNVGNSHDVELVGQIIASLEGSWHGRIVRGSEYNTSSSLLVDCGPIVLIGQSFGPKTSELIGSWVRCRGRLDAAAVETIE